MNSTTLPTSFLHRNTSSSSNSISQLTNLPPHSIKLHQPQSLVPIKATSPTPLPPVLIQRLKSFAKTAVLIAASASAAAHFSSLQPAKAQTSPATLVEETTPAVIEEDEQQQVNDDESFNSLSSPLSKFLDGNAEAVDSVKSLVQHKLQNGGEEEGEDALKILNRLVSAQPSVTEWKFLLARAYSQMGQNNNARTVFDEILAADPLSFEALSENALLMVKCGEGEGAISRLESALQIAEEEEDKVKEARDVRMIMAQVYFLQKNMEEALKIYHELSREDPQDFRPYYCKGIIYRMLNMNEEAIREFAKYRELSPKKGEVDGDYLRTPLFRTMEIESNDNN
ncbi:protein SLOW GREEN 1, chloroplastic [Linum grandiflorum]